MTKPIIDRSLTRFDDKLRDLLMATTHNKVVEIATKGVKGFDVKTYGKGMSSFTICIPTKLKADELMPCFVSHTDTVSQKKPKRFEIHDGVLSNPDGVLGADDRAGVFALSKMMQKKIRGVYIFTNGEEIGGLGAGACVKSEQFTDLVDNISCFIELDRQDDRDIALYGFDNSEMCDLFVNLGYKTAYGSYTDVVDFSTETELACINLSVGYTGQHTKHEDLDLADLDFTIDIMLNHLPKELYEKKYEADDIPQSWNSGYDDYRHSGMADEVLCDICQAHDRLWFTDEMMLCEYCAGIREDETLIQDDSDDEWWAKDKSYWELVADEEDL